MTEKMAGKMTDKEAPRNEIYYLNDVFEKMKQKEQKAVKQEEVEQLTL